MNSVSEWGANSGPSSAISTMTPTIPSPMRVRVSREALRRMPSHWKRWSRGGGASGPASGTRSRACSTVWSVIAPPSAAVA